MVQEIWDVEVRKGIDGFSRDEIGLVYSSDLQRLHQYDPKFIVHGEEVIELATRIEAYGVTLQAVCLRLQMQLPLIQ